MSLACVAGLQLTYTIVRAPDCSKYLFSSEDIPDRAGSAANTHQVSCQCVTTAWDACDWLSFTCTLTGHEALQRPHGMMQTIHTQVSLDSQIASCHLSQYIIAAQIACSSWMTSNPRNSDCHNINQFIIQFIKQPINQLQFLSWKSIGESTDKN